MVRVPMYKPLKGQSTRVEVRSIDAACNPYLAYAVVLAAGLKGIEEGYELPREAEDDVWALSDRELNALGIEPLPRSLNEAIAIAEDSELLAETLGEQVFDFFLRNKRAEWETYRAVVLRVRAGPDAAGHLRQGTSGSPDEIASMNRMSLRGDLLRAGFTDVDRPRRSWSQLGAVAEPRWSRGWRWPADPDLALAALLRLAEAAPDRDELLSDLVEDADAAGRLVAVLGASVALGDHLATHPCALAGAGRPDAGDHPVPAYAHAGLDARGGRRRPRRALPGGDRGGRRGGRRAEGRVPPDAAAAGGPRPGPRPRGRRRAAELADLAAGTLDAALAIARQRLGPDARAGPARGDRRWASAAAGELNYISDVDVIFVARAAAGTPRRRRLAAPDRGQAGLAGDPDLLDAD